MWRTELGCLGSTVKELIAFIERFLYVMHHIRYLSCTPLFSPHNNPGTVQLFSFTDEETETERNQRQRVLSGP